jgi:hypothetical protein
MSGMKIEIKVKKNIHEGMMKRNKRTEIMAHEELTPFTEQVLAQLGPVGANIRRRLKNFYRQRARLNGRAGEEPLGKNARTPESVS